MEALNFDFEKRYTYKDYAEWELKEGERYELIDGKAYAMSAPSTSHQLVLGNLHIDISAFLKGRRCRAFVAPFDVRLNAKGDKDNTVVQPDISVICDRSKIDGKGCNGAPDLIIEILSPTSGKHDRLVKFHKYQKAGVREYWMVDLTDRIIDVAVLNEGKYIISRYGEDEKIVSEILAGLEINPNQAFEDDWGDDEQLTVDS